MYRFTQLTTSQTYPAAPVRLPGLDPDAYPAAPVRLPGLDPDAVYRVMPLDMNRELKLNVTDGQSLDITNGQSPLGWWNDDGVCLTGRALQTYGITGRALQTYGIRPPSLHPAQAVLFTAVKQ